MDNKWIKQKFNEIEKQNKINTLCYIGKIPETSIYMRENKVCKEIKKDGKKYTIVYGLRVHKILMDLHENKTVDEIINKQKDKVKEMLNEEIQELAEKYIGIDINNLEINSIKPEWKVLTNQFNDPFLTPDNEVILIKYYRMTPTNEFIWKYHTYQELESMEKEEQ